jgi:hypothetical protein
MWQSSIYTRTCPTPARRSSPPSLSPTHGAGPGVLSTWLPPLGLNAGAPCCKKRWAWRHRGWICRQAHLGLLLACRWGRGWRQTPLINGAIYHADGTGLHWGSMPQRWLHQPRPNPPTHPMLVLEGDWELRTSGKWSDIGRALGAEQAPGTTFQLAEGFRVRYLRSLGFCDATPLDF